MARRYGVVVFRGNQISSIHIYRKEKKAREHVANVNTDDEFGLSAEFIDTVIFWDEINLIKTYIAKAEMIGITQKQISEIFRIDDAQQKTI